MSAEGGGVFLSSDVDLDVRLKVNKGNKSSSPTFAFHLFVRAFFKSPDRRASTVSWRVRVVNKTLKILLVLSRSSQAVGLHGRLPTVGQRRSR